MSEEQVKGFIDQATQSIQSGMFNQAIELADQALAIQPDNADAMILRGVALAQVNQPDAATEAFQKAVMYQPTNPKGHFNLAVNYSRVGQKTLALESAREAVRLDPGHAGARDLVIQMERELGVASEAGADAPPVQEGQPMGNPYANQNPYQQPAPYARQGYEQGAHSVAFVEKLGSTWTAIGWVSVAVYVVLMGVSIAMLGPMMREAFTNPEAAQAMQANQNPFLQILSWLNVAVGLGWMIIDIIDRRSSWLWLVVFVICCCCGPVQAIYMLAGRKQHN